MDLTYTRSSEVIKTNWFTTLTNSKHLGLILLVPAFVFILMFFVAPVFLTAVFGFTSMSTATGITGGSYLASQSSMLQLKDRHGMSALADDLSKIVYTIDTIGLEAAAQEGANQQTLDELSTKFLGQNFDNRRDVERIIKRLNHRPNNTRAIKAISKHFERSVLNTRYDSQDKLLTAIDNFGINLISLKVLFDIIPPIFSSLFSNSWFCAMMAFSMVNSSPNLISNAFAKP
mgnify:CR=1 FL=1